MIISFKIFSGEELLESGIEKDSQSNDIISFEDYIVGKEETKKVIYKVSVYKTMLAYKIYEESISNYDVFKNHLIKFEFEFICNNMSIEHYVEILTSVSKELIKEEEYEKVAFLRDFIKDLNEYINK